MQTIVVYKSKSGYTRNYAKWISKELNCEISELQDLDVSKLSKVDTVIYGGGLYAGGINGLKKFKKLMLSYHIPNAIIYFTGASPSMSFELEDITSRNFNSEEQKRFKFYYFRGGFDFNKCTFIDKILMLMLKVKMKSDSKKRELTADEKGMLEAYSQSVDFTKANKIKPLIDYVSSIV